MKKIWILFLMITPILWAQDDEEEEEKLPLEGWKSEIGVSGYFSAASQGGNLGLGLKLGIKGDAESAFVAGPSFRLLKYWSNFAGVKNSFNILGIGAFVHYRFQNVLYLGGEFEAMKMPTGYLFLNGSNQKYIPCLFLGGGYSQQFKNRLRVNLGIFYDIINNGNSPYRASYLTQKKVGPTGQPGALIPILYRIELVIPLGK